MPWTSKDAKRHTHKLKTGKQARQWSHVANSMLERTGDEGAAIRAANSVARRGGRKKGRKGRKIGRGRV